MIAEKVRVLLVCTVHHETGNATAAELHWLLSRLGPDVLFLEHAPSALTSFLDGSYGSSLESAAVRHYRQRHSIEVVPVGVDREVAELAELKAKADRLFEGVEEASPRFRQLQMANLEHTAKGGHGYLNSPVCATLQSEMQRVMRVTVEAVGESALVEHYALWTNINDQRELAMLTGVETYAMRTSFKKGVLPVGAGHRDSMMRKSQALRRDGLSPVVWDFDWELVNETP
jgi:hypothetical protein